MSNDHSGAAFDGPTIADLMKYAPRAQRSYVDALVNGWPAIQAAGINTPLRWCHFIAQCHHETGGFTIVRENTNWTRDQMCRLWPSRFKANDPIFVAKYAMCKGDELDVKLAEMAYGGRKDLGNTEPGDGWDYRGGGFLQGTGRGWYRETGEAIGVDLEGNPDLIENCSVSLKATLWYWTRYKINDHADANNLRAVGNQINRGNPYSKHEPIDADKRKRQFDRAWAIWGENALPRPDGLNVGSAGPEVLALQLRLRELRYAVGNADGVFGRETGRAVAAFKADWKHERGYSLDPDLKVGPTTLAALADARPIERKEREQTTPGELLAAGSTEMKAGQEMKTVGTALAAGGGLKAASDAGLLDTLNSSVGWLPSAQSTVAPAIESVKWAMGNLFFVGLVGLGLLIWYRGYLIQHARLIAHRLGFNLSR